MTATPREQAELRILIRQLGEPYQFTEKEKHEAFAAACADPDNALTALRDIADGLTGR